MNGIDKKFPKKPEGPFEREAEDKLASLEEAVRTYEFLETKKENIVFPGLDALDGYILVSLKEGNGKEALALQRLDRIKKDGRRKKELADFPGDIYYCTHEATINLEQKRRRGQEINASRFLKSETAKIFRQDGTVEEAPRYGFDESAVNPVDCDTALGALRNLIVRRAFEREKEREGFLAWLTELSELEQGQLEQELAGLIKKHTSSAKDRASVVLLYLRTLMGMGLGSVEEKQRPARAAKLLKSSFDAKQKKFI